jgi:hypothetical protein
MAEGPFAFEAADQVEAERYQVEQIRLTSGTDVFPLATLQEAVNRGARHSWRLVGVAQDPTGQGVLVVWDTTVASPGPSYRHS